MLRMPAFAALFTAGFGVPALADNITPRSPVEPGAIQAFTAQLSWRANQIEMRRMLAHQGFFATSDLDRRDSGHWVGTALKDGVPLRIAIKMPPRETVAPLTN